MNSKAADNFKMVLSFLLLVGAFILTALLVVNNMGNGKAVVTIEVCLGVFYAIFAAIVSFHRYVMAFMYNYILHLYYEKPRGIVPRRGYARFMGISAFLPVILILIANTVIAFS